MKSLSDFRCEQIGDATLYLGDSREILSFIDPSNSSIVSDPPYGISLVPQRQKTKSIANDGKNEAKNLWRSILELSFKGLPEDSSHIFWTGWSEVWTNELLSDYFKVKSCIVWAKNNFGIGYYTRPQHEFAWYCHKGKPPVLKNPVSDLWPYPKIQAPIHSCEKPVGLLEKCVNLVSHKSILDPFMGVGSTGVACVKLGRKFTGVELDPDYFEIACDRIRKAYQQADLFVAPPEKPIQAKQESFI